MREITVYNTLTRRKEILRTQEPGKVKMYACGVTVYDECHVGHAMQAVFFDVIRNYLGFAGYDVTYVRNYTDVDDKIIARAGERGLSPVGLAESIIASSDADMRAIGVAPATFEPRVSGSIGEIIAMVEELIRRGYAYTTPAGDVYYRVRAKSDYGKLSNRRPDDLQSGTRSIVHGEKADELDFALWKADQTPGASWPSPWGPGRPGWHIECSAMARTYLGASFDIHGGGRDLVFPHHENEIAQSEAANQAPFASYWLHSGLLTINKQKMSKSLGNHLPIKAFLKRWPAEVLRLGFLRSHYASNIDFSEEVFRDVRARLLYYYESLANLDAMAVGAAANAAALPDFKPDEIVANFHQAMADDFNTAQALAELNRHFRRANELARQKATPARAATAAIYGQRLREVGKVLGLLNQDPTSFIEELKDRVISDLGIRRADIETGIAERRAARAAKDFARGDEIRAFWASRGIELKDLPSGATTWTIKGDEHG